MKDNVSPIQAEQIRPLAETAVQGYLRRQFPAFFSEEEQQDLVSDTVLRIWRSRDSYDPARGALTTWVGIIAKNVVRTAALAKTNRSVISARLDDGAPDGGVGTPHERTREWSADADLIAEETLDGFFKALGNERDRRFLAWQLDELEPSEMAKREGISEQNVHTIICRMRRKLRNAA